MTASEIISAHRPRILICDDEPLMTSSIQALLSYSGNYEIVTSNNPLQALDIIHDISPDLLILDITMPEMTGFELLDAVQNNQIDSDIIFVSGESSMDFAIQAIRKGASDFLRKPFEPEELCIRVDNVLRQRQTRLERDIIFQEKKLLESQLRQSQKMEAIGTLAGGIAHDFNNVLSIIMGNTELVKFTLDQDHKGQPYVQQILSASARARELIKQLLSFSRKEEDSLKPMDIKEVISESLTLMRASLPTNIKIESNLCSDDCIIRSDATQMQQIIFNLCTNASHAMEANGGCISLTLKPVKINSAEDDLNIPSGEYIHLQVKDTGQGIPEDVIDHIFEPYFTTKAVDKGTGMGLAVVHGIIKRRGGCIHAESTAEKGTTFHIYLPRLETPAKKESKNIDRRVLPRGNESILMVDDESMIVEMMEKVLSQLGYTVKPFCSSEKALIEFKANPQGYDLLITDMTMPGISGSELIKAMRLIREKFPVILSTGFNSQLNDEMIKSLNINALIMKPVDIENLAFTLRKILQKSADRRKTPRYGVMEGTLVYSHNHSRHYNLLDIGQTGLAFCHNDDNYQSTQEDLLTIVSRDGKPIINKIPCQYASSIPIGGNNPENHVRKGVSFDAPSALHQNLLKEFIQNNAGNILH